MNLLLVLRVVVLVGSLTSCSIYDAGSFTDYESGAQKAAEDIAVGRYAQMDNIGIIRSGTIEMRELLKKDYGIEYVESLSSSSDYVRGYNTIMRSAAKKRFGDDYHERAWKQIVPEGMGAFGGLLDNGR